MGYLILVLAAFAFVIVFGVVVTSFEASNERKRGSDE